MTHSSCNRFHGPAVAVGPVRERSEPISTAAGMRSKVSGATGSTISVILARPPPIRRRARHRRSAKQADTLSTPGVGLGLGFWGQG